MDSIIIIDFGSQYSQLITRRIRELHIYSELIPWDAPPDRILDKNPKGFILSGGPASVYEKNSPQIPSYVFQSGLPILGICYGMQALTFALGGQVAHSIQREYGSTKIVVSKNNPLLPIGEHQVWMSHGDRIEKLPNGFIPLANSKNSPISACGDLKRDYYGLQFHPEVHHTPIGKEILKNFVIDICHMQPSWTAESIITESVQSIRQQVGNEIVISAVSGGVDSSVATAIVQKAIGKQLIAIFVDNGLLRKDEVRQVQSALHHDLGVELIIVDAVDLFMTSLKGIINPEKKRKIIGELFIRIFEEQAKGLGNPRFLVQGTIYPDVVESSAHKDTKSHKIKTHHNVGGIPLEMDFELVEPLRLLFKDEVRLVGEVLGLPDELIWRQPFPGPGLAVRCLGEITPERLNRLREADAIFTEELSAAGLLRMNKTIRSDRISGSAQAFAVLLPIQSVGVMGDQRTYQETIVLRAITTEDFMTADWARIPFEILEHVSNRIVNEVAGINRVVYDITSKPPATIEWE